MMNRISSLPPTSVFKSSPQRPPTVGYWGECRFQQWVYPPTLSFLGFPEYYGNGNPWAYTSPIVYYKCGC